MKNETMGDDVKPFVDQFESFQNSTIEARAESERDQDYDDHKQWTEEEQNTLQGRNQAPVVINRVKKKVNTLTGIQKKTRTQPRALPRTPAHEDAADAATEALRYVKDNTRFDGISSQVFRREVVWGYGAAITEIEKRGKEKEIVVREIQPDRFYFDPFSRELDFSDASYMGIVLWMDKPDIQAMFPKAKADDIFIVTDSTGDQTFDDKPRWVDTKRQRARVCQHFYKKNGEWWTCYFTSNVFLQEPAKSPYQDEFGEPCCPIEAQSAYIDRDGNRYGEVRSYIWLQDEINHRRSKLLYNISVRQVIYEEGAVNDIGEAKQELATANGAVKVNPGRRFEIIDNVEANAVQFNLMQHSEMEIDEVGAGAALGGGGTRDQSGRHLQLQQQGEVVELASLFDGHRQWEHRMYRQFWNRIKQFWKAEKWVRVTDDEKNLDWVGLNRPVTVGEKLQEAAQQGSQEAAALLQQMTLAGDVRLNEQAEIKNNVAELDVDIILSVAPDFVTIRQEQFEILGRLAEKFPQQNMFEALLTLSDMPNKEEIKTILKGDVDPAQQQLQQMVQQLELSDKEVSVMLKQAKAAKDQAATEQMQLKNQMDAAGFETSERQKAATAALTEAKVGQTQVDTILSTRDPNPQTVS